MVRALVPPPEVDLAAMMRDDDSFRAVVEASAPLYDPSFRCAMSTVTETWRDGVAGLREVWLEWLEPWASYRAVEEDVVDLGGGRVRDGRITEAIFYASRAQALEAAGL